MKELKSLIKNYAVRCVESTWGYKGGVLLEDCGAEEPNFEPWAEKPLCAYKCFFSKRQAMLTNTPS